MRPIVQLQSFSSDVVLRLFKLIVKLSLCVYCINEDTFKYC